MMQILYLDISSILPSGQEPRTSNLSNLFWNLEDSVLVETLSYRSKITYHPFITDWLFSFSFSFSFFLSMLDIGHMMHLHEKRNFEKP